MEFTKTYYETLGETVYSATHKSGLQIILIKKSGFKKSYATFSTKYGSINTEFVVPGENETTKVIPGIAHFLEHKVFEQPDGSNAFNDFSKYGANANAFTSFGVTNYLFSCTDYFYENLEILLGFVQTPYFTEENVEKEKGIIAQEIRMYEDDAEQTCMYNCLEAMYENHPVRINIAGGVDDIMKTTPELLYKCYNTFYHPSNMALICVGDLDENKIWDCVEKCIKKDSPHGEITQVFPEESTRAFKRNIEASFDIPIPMFMIGFKDPETGGTGKEMLKREILTNCILRTLFGKSSDFYKKLYDKGVINKSFSAFYEYEQSCGYAAFFGESESIPEIEKEIFKTVEEAKKNGINKENFERARKVYLGNFMETLDNVESFGNDYMFAYHKGIDLFDYVSVCENISLEDAIERLKTLFKEEQCSTSTVLPKEKEGDA
ncbi:MAG: insulinase family protein [Ruminococcaceae bacterium]|nr:insulinase family protein [Oscillospiraceae bacterium]